jgi:hypothetical protein
LSSKRTKPLSPNQQEPRDFFAALQVDGGDVLIAPGNECHARFDRREAELDRRVDLAHHAARATDRDEPALARVVAGHDRDRVGAVVARTAQLAVVDGDAPQLLAALGVEREELPGVAGDHDVARDDR